MNERVAHADESTHGRTDDHSSVAGRVVDAGPDPASTDEVGELLAAIAASLPGGGENRPGQRLMAEAVRRALGSHRHLIVQAGTGTGKSLAYLLPVVTSGVKCVIATATRALQDQLASKDLPLIARHLSASGPAGSISPAGSIGPAGSISTADSISPAGSIGPADWQDTSWHPADTFTFAVLKGRSNYLCKQRAAEVQGELPGAFGGESGPMQALSGAEPAGTPGGFGDEVRRLIQWAAASPTGDRAELDFEPHPRVWASLSLGSRECPGAFRCPSGQDCFAELAKARAAAADVVVVNTHLYATHVASHGAVLPPHEVVVFDEAHEVEDIMTAGLGVEITPGRFRALAQAGRGQVSRGDSAALDALVDAAERLSSMLAPLVGTRLRSRAADKAPATQADASAPSVEPVERVLTPAVRGRPGSQDQLWELLELLAGRVDAASDALRRAERAHRSGLDDASRRVPTDQSAPNSADRTRALLAAEHLADDLAKLASLGPEEVAWVDNTGSPGRNIAIRVAPIDVGPILAEHVWPHATAVLASATIPPLLREHLGLPEDLTDTLDVGSPFPYETNSLLYCAAHLPDRRSDTARQALTDELVRLINAAGGRTLALFTSISAMKDQASAVAGRVDYPILVQGQLPKPRLVDAFASDESTCLFATVSFWQGVDVPGATSILVAIDRIPFPRPDDPLLQARRERSADGGFRSVDLPRAATLLAQGAGRLIRSVDDAGVVAVLDSRLATKSYGRTLLAALPSMPFTTDPDRAAGFLERLASRERHA